MKKTIIISLLLMFMLLQLSPMAAKAADAPALVLTAPQSVKQGETVDVSIGISSNPGLAGAQLRLVFPTDWKLVSAEVGAAFSGAILEGSPSSLTPATLIWVYQAASKTDGEMIHLCFDVDINAAAGDGLVIVQCKNAYDGDEAPVTLAQKSKRITVLALDAEERPALMLSNAVGVPGGLAAVKLSAVNQFRVSTAEITLDYDPNLLELVEVIPAAGFPTQLFWASGSPTIAWTSLTNVEAGDIAVCYFRLRSDDANDYPAAVSLHCKLYNTVEAEIQGVSGIAAEVGSTDAAPWTTSCENGVLTVSGTALRRASDSPVVQYIAVYGPGNHMTAIRLVTADWSEPLLTAKSVNLSFTAPSEHGRVSVFTFDTNTLKPLADKLDLTF